MPATVEQKQKAEEYLKNMKEATKHYRIKESGVRWWNSVFLLGVSTIVISLTLSFYNPFFAKSDKTFFVWMWPIYLGGTIALLTNIVVHDATAEFCTPKLAQNHVMEMCMLLSMRSLWWTAIQCWSWSESYWYIIPILGGYALEWVYYVVTLWGRHRRTCPYHNKGVKDEESGKGMRNFMLVLDLIWGVAQVMQLVVGILYDDELLV